MRREQILPHTCLLFFLMKSASASSIEFQQQPESQKSFLLLEDATEPIFPTRCWRVPPSFIRWWESVFFFWTPSSPASTNENPIRPHHPLDRPRLLCFRRLIDNVWIVFFAVHLKFWISNALNPVTPAGFREWSGGFGPPTH